MNYLKTTFKILPAAGLELSLYLMIEAGAESISFVYYAKDPLKVEGILIYQFEKNCTAAEMANALTHFFAQENLPGFVNCNICYNYVESTIVPASFYKENLHSEMLDAVYSNSKNAADYAANITEMDALIMYRVDSRIGAVLKQQFPLATIQHSSAFQIPEIIKKGNLLYCIVYQNSIKVIAVKDHILQIVQFFDFTKPADVAYHLLNVCTQHGLSPQQILLTLSGFIDKKSNLYDELYRYFLNIELEEYNNDVEVSEAVSQYPLHFFSHLIQLVKCVS